MNPPDPSVLVNAANDAIVTADVDGRVTSWNFGAERTFGYSAAEILGEPLTILIPERFQQAHEEGIARVASGGDRHLIGRTIELFGVRRGGVEFPIELSLTTWQEPDATTANFGSDERLDYTIVGGQVNAAARLEAAAEAGEVLVSHQTWALITDEIRCNPVGEIKVKGIAHPLLTYEVVGAGTTSDPERAGSESSPGRNASKSDTAVQ